MNEKLAAEVKTENALLDLEQQIGSSFNQNFQTRIKQPPPEFTWAGYVLKGKEYKSWRWVTQFCYSLHIFTSASQGVVWRVK